MAEQAINTIYLLGDKPDTLCEDITHNFTRKVFGPKPQGSAAPEDIVEESQPTRASTVAPEEGSVEPEASRKETSAMPSGDMGDSFQLSQLLFLVGHVAIKHLVYLEMAERVLKHRKDLADKGKLHQLAYNCPGFHT
jgi:condensin complex subunit 1